MNTEQRRHYDRKARRKLMETITALSFAGRRELADRCQALLNDIDAALLDDARGARRPSHAGADSGPIPTAFLVENDTEPHAPPSWDAAGAPASR